MEEYRSSQPTQPITATQRAKRVGSGLSQQDLSDVICILHPTTSAAVAVVTEVARRSPQHILQTDPLPTGHDDDDRVARDIALRLSSRLRDPCAGFLFGRNPDRCDIVMRQYDAPPRISNVHFRIFLTPDEVLMLQDVSTNGTVVDGVLLGGTMPDKAVKPPRRLRATSRMLTASSMINLIGNFGDFQEEIKFVVRIPPRHGQEDAYDTQVNDFLDRIERERRQRATVRRDGPPGNRTQPPQFLRVPNPPPPPVPYPVAQALPHSRGRLAKAWTGGPKYNVVGTIGKGAFATVYRVANKDNGDIFAAKELSKRQFRKNNTADRKFDTEMAIMKRLRHPHIVQYIEHLVEQDAMYIIMEFVPRGDLSTLIYEHGPLPELAVKAMTRQMLDALDYLHRCKVTHRDIKPDNILIVRPQPLEVKLSDFGLSKIVNEQTFLKTFCGTLLYCAPEVFSKYPEYLKARTPKRRREQTIHQPRSYSHACDVWSFGAVLFMSLSAKPPYTVETGDRDSMLDKIMTTELDVAPLQRQRISDNGIAFVRMLLHLEPQLRPTEEECLADVWLRDGSPTPSMKVDEDGARERAVQSPIEELDASGLRLDEAIDDRMEDEGDFDDVDLDEPAYVGARSSKRIKTAASLACPGEADEEEEEEEDPALLDASSRWESLTRSPAKANRLFGEVGVSALGSSGVIPPEHLNLEVSVNEEVSFATSDASMVERVLDRAEPEDPPTEQYLPASPVQVVNSEGDQVSSQPGAAASLFGAESLVGHLNMTSASPPGSADDQSHGSMVVTEQTDMAVALARLDPRRYEENEGSGQARRPGKPRPNSTRKFVRRVSMAVPDSYYYDAYDKSTHNAGYAARMRAQGRSPNAMHVDMTVTSMPDLNAPRQNPIVTSGGGVRAQSQPLGQYRMEVGHQQVKVEESDHEKVNGSSVISEERRSTKPEIDHDARSPTLAPGSSPGREKGSVEDIQAVDPSTFVPPPSSPPSPLAVAVVVAAAAAAATSTPSPLVRPQSMRTMTTMTTMTTNSGANGFARPLPVLGKLISTPQSLLALTIQLNQRENSWGRGGNNTIIFPNGQDTRVPKYAFDILFWRSGLPALIEKGVAWTEVANVTAIIRSRASRPISVNGVPLINRQQTGDMAYGRLYTGDVLTIWEDKDSAKEISLVCEFYLGASVGRRPTNRKPFGVEYGQFESSSS